MQVAEIISDLTSLRVCDYHDALALVTVNERLSEAKLSSDERGKAAAIKQRQEQQNADLLKAKELVDLHYEMKAKHAQGTVDEELARARDAVARVLRDLEG
ncbi:uncharacterized protein ACLA_036090 [Aspergillus clavatus NRRL 1]|uniref:Uncharacterized protein n=1 Tax=Aspergillus clavatus (strain ATCC 1007 / CBS 513.65 / DSM 816 / NCTC 3887 / NRRL 1 / QM 1276 / 107) TaxID=344612 RepID=A1CJT2_ASPCL|nr:uncharacterized protein ACLA_036090 [Aspergillus clavatus NRRL 1]EAW09406.1 conserved hypothetical protein [Aspergillus clavatus NRRL 1]